MGTYRKPHKAEAYQHALRLVGEFTDHELYPQDATARLAYSLTSEILTGAYPTLTADDIRDVFSKALGATRGIRDGSFKMKARPFELSEADSKLLTDARAKHGHTTDVSALRAAIREYVLK